MRTHTRTAWTHHTQVGQATAAIVIVVVANQNIARRTPNASREWYQCRREIRFFRKTTEHRVTAHNCDVHNLKSSATHRSGAAFDNNVKTTNNKIVNREETTSQGFKETRKCDTDSGTRKVLPWVALYSRKARHPALHTPHILLAFCCAFCFFHCCNFYLATIGMLDLCVRVEVHLTFWICFVRLTCFRDEASTVAYCICITLMDMQFIYTCARYWQLQALPYQVLERYKCQELLYCEKHGRHGHRKWYLRQLYKPVK
jgi:hypothetical protein